MVTSETTYKRQVSGPIRTIVLVRTTQPLHFPFDAERIRYDPTEVWSWIYRLPIRRSIKRAI